MNILIPIGGIGERFSKEGYQYPKPLINVLGKPMIIRVLESFKIKDTDTITIVFRNEFNHYNFKSIIQNYFPHQTFNFVELFDNTRGATETVLCGLNTLPETCLNEPIMIADCDTFYDESVVEMYSKKLGNCIFYFTDNDNKPIFSYIDIDSEGKVLNIKEKEKISHNANTGLYCFESALLLKNYCEKTINYNNTQKGEFYISGVYQLMLSHRLLINSCHISNFYCVGTPFQLQLFASTHTDEKKRFCFDLDNTLVSFPVVSGDYSTVEPINQNINFARFLKKNGHTVIIHTARRMKTHKGNVGSVIADIGAATLETIKKYDIPCDELYFGKPYAHFYIDDLAINPYTSSLSKETGFYDVEVAARSFNTIEYKDDKVIKTSISSGFEGEKYWYSHIPKNLSFLFPDIHEISDKIVMDKINGLSFSSLYVNGSLTDDNFMLLLTSLEIMHGLPEIEHYENEWLYRNYNDKLVERYKSYDYSHFPNCESLFKELSAGLEKYKLENKAKVGVIHGDMVFTNIFLTKDYLINFIDMRGKLGDTLTIYGDIFYDYAKILQSLCGYDHILFGQTFNKPYMNKFKARFIDFLTYRYGTKAYEDVRLITKSLLFTLIPLHDNEKCQEYYRLINDT